MIKKIFLLFILLSVFSLEAKLTKEQKTKLKKTTKWLASFDLRYAKPWTPPDSTKAINMDCSNTARFIYKQSLGVDLPSGGSYDMYTAFKKKRLVNHAPMLNPTTVHTRRLRRKLRSGDLLFWINTHSDIGPNSNPPVSHVMIYLGKTKKNVMRMVGSNTFGKGKYTSGGGPDVYVFDPNQSIGCVRSVKTDKKSPCIPGKESRFFAFARPILQRVK